jgi:hypothetical protein
VERGRLYEGLCTAKLEKRHRPYHGMAITAGAIEMAKDDDKDVSSLKLRQYKPNDLIGRNSRIRR